VTLRREDRGPLTGTARYIDDVDPPEVLEVAFVRSPFASARLLEIDASEAVDVPGLHGIYTYVDLPSGLREPLPLAVESPNLRAPRNRTALVAERVRHEAEPLAAVLATDRYRAEDAANDVQADLQPCPLVVDIEDSVRGRHLVHEEMSSNLGGVIEAAHGDVDTALEQAPHVLEFEHRIERSTASPMEGRGVVAIPEHDGLLVYSSTQAPHGLQAALAAVLRLPRRQVRVVAPRVGGGFGQKGVFPGPEEAIVSWLALLWGRPVKWVEDRRENLTAATQARGQHHRIRVGFHDDGRIDAYDITVRDDIGAYVPYGLVPSKNTAVHLLGPYAIDNVRMRVESYFTNLPPVAPYRGAGRPEGTYAIERTLDAVADALARDRTAVRNANVIRRDRMPYSTGLVVEGSEVVYDSGDYARALTQVTELLAPRPESGDRLQGRAAVLYVESTSFGPYETAILSVEPDGDIVVRLATSDQGQGHATMAAEVIAQELGVDSHRMDVRLGDTLAPRHGVGTFASRSTIMVTNALADACRKLRDVCLAIAADMWGVDRGDITYSEGAVHHPQRGTLSLRELSLLKRPGRGHYGADRRLLEELRARGLQPPEGTPGLEVEGTFHQDAVTFAYGAHAAEISIDPDTGALSVDRYVVVHDCGRVLSRERVDGQVHGGVAQGIGGALYERMEYTDSGILANASFMDFLMPYATEIPPMEIHHLETASPLNPMGLKGAGEGGVLPVSALIAAAIEDATGAQVRRMPLRPSDVQDLVVGSTDRPGSDCAAADQKRDSGSC
jgi:carbon-monoxide dehydrogenase large subunit